MTDPTDEVRPPRDKDRKRPTAKDYGDWFLSHCREMWAAEREVAARWSDRGKTLLTTASAASAGLFAVLAAGVLRLPAVTWNWATVSLAAGTVCCFAVAMSYLFRVGGVLLVGDRRPHDGTKPSTVNTPARIKPDTSSYHLWPPPEFLDWTRRGLSRVVVILSSQLLQATEDLQRRNLQEHERIRRAERMLGKGFVWTIATLVALLLFAAVSSWQGSSADVKANGKGHAHADRQPGTGPGDRDAGGEPAAP